MNQLLTGQFEKWAVGIATSLLALLGPCAAGGCGRLRFSENGEFGIKYEHNIMFVHKTAETKATSVAEWAVPSVEEWIKGTPEPETVEP